MKSSKTHFEELLLDTEKWKYYDNLKVEDKLENILNNPKNFITSYLQAAGKLPPEEITAIIENLSINRLQHTISIFLLGILLYSKSNQIKHNLDSFLQKKKEEIESTLFPNIDISFCYYWFLICFFHDIGYSRISKTINQYNFKMFNKTEINDIKEEVVKILVDNPENYSIPAEISKSWKSYLIFKEKHDNPKIQEDIDHGILAGAYFYYMLNNIYNKKKSSRNEKEFIDESGLFWSQDMVEKVHKPIAWIIVAHNIWFKNRNCEDTKDYEEKNLTDLIIDEPIVILDKNPFYFLLCLVDSLDPIKYLLKKNETDIISMLNNTLLLVTKEGYIDIKFINNYRNFNCDYQEMIFSLRKWLGLGFQIII